MVIKESELNTSLSIALNTQPPLEKKRTSAISQILKDLSSNTMRADLEVDGFHISIPNTIHDLQSCYKLAYEEYLKKGYVNPNTNKDMITAEYDLDTNTMVAMVKNPENETIATLSIVIDSKKGLPSDELFADELNTYRSEARLAEVVRLAVKDEYKNHQEVLIGMFDLVFNYVRDIANCRYLVIEVNPRHALYYERLLWFENISSEKSCPRVKGAPAVLLCLDFVNNAERILHCDTDHNKRNMYRRFLKGNEKVDLNKMITSSMAKLSPQMRSQALCENSAGHLKNSFAGLNTY